MEMNHIQVTAKEDGYVWMYQDDESEHGSSIRLNVEQIPLLCRWLLDAAEADVADIPSKLRQSTNL